MNEILVDREELQRQKILKRVPCGRMEATRNGKEEMVFPAVDCDLKCDTCGWNPVISFQRKEKVRAELAKRKKLAKARK